MQGGFGGHGGGFYIRAHSTASMTTSTVSNNTAGDATGIDG